MEEELKRKCEKCGQESPIVAKFCLFCGSKFDCKKVCPICDGNVIYNENAKFCFKCGSELVCYNGDGKVNVDAQDDGDNNSVVASNRQNTTQKNSNDEVDWIATLFGDSSSAKNQTISNALAKEKEKTNSANQTINHQIQQNTNSNNTYPNNTNQANVNLNQNIQNNNQYVQQQQYQNSNQYQQPAMMQNNVSNQAHANNAMLNGINPNESKYTGSVFGKFGFDFASFILSLLTFGIALPWLKCWKERYHARHTWINGRQLVFDGTAMQLVGSYFKWFIFIVLTFGIYGFWMIQNMKRWTAKHTHFVGFNHMAQSSFNGLLIGLIGVNIWSGFLTGITFGLAFFWMKCWKERWYAKHTIIDNVQLDFNGKGSQFFGKCFVWVLLTIITFGIYGFWLSESIKKWIVSHTIIAGSQYFAMNGAMNNQMQYAQNGTYNANSNNNNFASPMANQNFYHPDYASSLTFNIVGWVCLCLGITSVLGLIFSIIALVKSNRVGRTGVKVSSIILLVLSALVIAFILIILVRVSVGIGAGVEGGFAGAEYSGDVPDYSYNENPNAQTGNADNNYGYDYSY